MTTLTEVSTEADPHVPVIRMTRVSAATPGRDAWLSSGMESGVSEGYANLDALLAEGVV